MEEDCKFDYHAFFRLWHMLSWTLTTEEYLKYTSEWREKHKNCPREWDLITL